MIIGHYVSDGLLCLGGGAVVCRCNGIEALPVPHVVGLEHGGAFSAAGGIQRRAHGKDIVQAETQIVAVQCVGVMVFQGVYLHLELVYAHRLGLV